MRRIQNPVGLTTRVRSIPNFGTRNLICSKKENEIGRRLGRPILSTRLGRESQGSTHFYRLIKPVRKLAISHHMLGYSEKPSRCLGLTRLVICSISQSI